MRHQTYRLLLLFVICLAVKSYAQADSYAPPITRYFVSDSHILLFKTIPPRRIDTDGKPSIWVGENTGVLYRSWPEGEEQELWRTKLVNFPRVAFVSDGGNAVVTIDTWGPPPDKHAVVVYGAKGETLADYSPEDLLTPEEFQKFKEAIRFPEKQTVASLWLYEAEFSLNQGLFIIRFAKDSVVVIDLKTGNARRENGVWLPRKAQPASK